MYISAWDKILMFWYKKLLPFYPTRQIQLFVDKTQRHNSRINFRIKPSRIFKRRLDVLLNQKRIIRTPTGRYICKWVTVITLKRVWILSDTNNASSVETQMASSPILSISQQVWNRLCVKSPSIVFMLYSHRLLWNYRGFTRQKICNWSKMGLYTTQMSVKYEFIPEKSPYCPQTPNTD